MMDGQPRWIVLAVLCFAFFGHASAQRPQEAGIQPFLGEPEFMVRPVFRDGRFPNVVITLDGTILATWGQKRIRVQRSEDGGSSWSKEIIVSEQGIHGGGTTVDESTGDILVFVEDQHPPAPLTVFRSSDDGRSWTAQETRIASDSQGRMPAMHMNEHGITLRRGEHKGRLVRPSRHYGKGNRPKSLFPTHYTNAIYSDDGGRTWSTSEPFSEFGTGEAAVAQLADGSIYYNSRRHWAPDGKSPYRRWTASSSDDGESWSQAEICEVLPDGPQDTTYGCMGGLTRLPVEGMDILVYSNSDSDRGRKRGTVWGSFDGGKTWPVKRLVDDGPFAYSSMTSGRPGTSTEGKIFLHFESQGSKMAIFNLSWLLAGESTNDGELPDLN